MPMITDAGVARRSANAERIWADMNIFRKIFSFISLGRPYLIMFTALTIVLIGLLNSRLDLMLFGAALSAIGAVCPWGAVKRPGRADDWHCGR